MKYCKRYFCAFLCCLLLSIGFSSTVSADETVLDNTEVKIDIKFRTDDGLVNWASHIIYPNNNTEEWLNDLDYRIDGKLNNTIRFHVIWTVKDDDGNVILKRGRPSTINLQNAYFNIGYSVANKTTPSTNITSTYIQPTDVSILVSYTDGTSEYLEPTDYFVGTSTNIVFDITPEKDIKSLEYHLYSDKIPIGDMLHVYKFWYHSGEILTDNSFNIVIESQSEEAGLLSGLLGWVKNINDKIVGGFSSVVSGISNAVSKIGEVTQSITELPSKLWQLISDGLKALFVPTEEQLTQFKNDMDSLLEQKLGAVYQVVNILFEGWDEIQANKMVDSIEFPKVSIPLPDNNTFEFGGFDVNLAVGWEPLYHAIEIIVSISCTILFVNGLRKRYDDIMGGN